MKTLDEARIEIDQIDKEMVVLFEKRMQAVEDVVKYKIEHNLKVFDETREKAVIDKNSQLINNRIYLPYYQNFLQNLMDVSKCYQRTFVDKVKIGYQGTLGAFSHIAATKLYGDQELFSFPTFDNVFKAVRDEAISYGVIPFENSYTGEVGEVLDLLRKYDDIYIEDMFDLKVDQNLLGIPGSKLKDIKEVYSHQQALSQCQLFLSGMGVKQQAYPNTALAAKFVSEQNDRTLGAIASLDTAKLFNLEVLKESINTSKENTTRFIIISKNLKQQGERFSILFSVKHDAGSLASVMEIIAKRGYNMENIRSRSLADIPWQYYFYVQMIGNVNAESTKKLIEEMSQQCDDLRLIGCF